MAIEVERKFLVLAREGPLPPGGAPIEQGYLTTVPPVLRIRLMDGRGYLNVKTPRLPARARLDGIAAQVARAEYEYEIPVRDAEDMMELAVFRLRKTRHFLEGGFELDVFEGGLAGLELLEYESEDIESMPPLPGGMTLREVTGDPLFSNIRLAMEGLPEMLRARGR